MTRLIHLPFFLCLFLLAAFDVHAQTARIQLIHNSADPSAAMVDIYIDQELKFDDVPFRAATPFFEVPANVPVEIGIAPGNSASADDIIFARTTRIARDVACVGIASGVLNPDNFATNPNGEDITFDIILRENIRESATDPQNVDSTW